MRGTTPAPRRLPLKFRASETRLGGLLVQTVVLAISAYLTYLLCDSLATSAAGVAQPAFSRADLGSQAVTAAVQQAPKSDKGTIHVMATSNGSPYLNWQTRIMYKTFELTRAEGGEHMKYFTRCASSPPPGARAACPPVRRDVTTVRGRSARLQAAERGAWARRGTLLASLSPPRSLLHRRTDDELMAEVPTVRVDSLHASCDKCARSAGPVPRVFTPALAGGASSPWRTVRTRWPPGCARTTASWASGYT